MKESLATVALGIAIGILGVSALIDLSPNSYKNIVDRALQECEKSLPRNEHCVIVALPISKD